MCIRDSPHSVPERSLFLTTDGFRKGFQSLELSTFALNLQGRRPSLPPFLRSNVPEEDGHPTVDKDSQSGALVVVTHQFLGLVHLAPCVAPRPGTLLKVPVVLVL